MYWRIGGATEEWAMRVPCAIVVKYPEGAFYVKPGSLVFSVVVFTICALATFGILALRRSWVGGELGGKMSTPFALVLCLLWALYAVLSCLKAEAVI